MDTIPSDCPRSSSRSRDSFYIVSYHIKWVPTSWTYRLISMKLEYKKISLVYLSMAATPYFIMSSCSTKCIHQKQCFGSGSFSC